MVAQRATVSAVEDGQDLRDDRRGHLLRPIGANVEPEYLPERAGDVRDSQADIGKAKAILGYSPVITFEEGLRRTVDWYRTQG